MKNPRHVGNADTVTIVIKLGTSSIVSESTLQPRLELLSALVHTVCTLRAQGHRVVLVSSGAIGMGLKRMARSKRPKALAETQGLAAIGQGRLIALWDNLFGLLDQPIAQVLLTRSDISDRSRYLNSTKTLNSLLSMGVVPIVNENDTISVSEIKFGDNDTLSAIAAAMVSADYLCLMTDVDCLYTENPRKNPANARAVKVVRDIEQVRRIVSVATLGSSLGTGGMETKLIAAELATGAGVSTVITNSAKPSTLLSLVSDNSKHSIQNDSSDEQVILSDSPVPYTIFLPPATELLLPDRRWWIAHGLAPRGEIYIDQGAYRAIFKKENHHHSHHHHHHQLGNGGRLLPAGVIKVKGVFAAGQSVRVFVVVNSSASLASTTASSTPICNCSTSNSTSTSRSSSPVASTKPSRSSTPTIPVTTMSSSTQVPPTSSSSCKTPDSPSFNDSDAIEVGRGLANYNSVEIDRLKGLKSSEIEKVLGYIESEHVVGEITAHKYHHHHNLEQQSSPITTAATSAISTITT